MRRMKITPGRIVITHDDLESGVVSQHETRHSELDEKVELVADAEKLFRYSGMLDALRDAAEVLYKSGTPSRETIASMVEQYHALRVELAKVVRDDLGAEVYRWSPDLEKNSVSIDGLYVAAVQLARWMDVVHQTPRFLLSERVAAAGAQKIENEMVEIETPTAARDAANGLYL